MAASRTESKGKSLRNAPKSTLCFIYSCIWKVVVSTFVLTLFHGGFEFYNFLSTNKSK